MPRTFNGTSDKLDMTPGAAAVTMGGLTLVAIGKRNSTGQNPLIAAYDGSANERWNLKIESNANGNHLTCGNGAADAFTTNASMLLTNADGWFLAAVSKTTGTVAPRFHLYKYGTDTAAHVNSADTLTDGTALAAGQRINIGFSQRWTEWYGGDIAVAGIFPAALSDSQIESLAFSLQAWYSMKPLAMWVLDQSVVTQKVVDQAGGGANETARTGTTVSTNSVSVFGYGHPVQRVLSAPAGGGTTFTDTPAGTITLSGALSGTWSQSVTPSGIITLSGSRVESNSTAYSPSGIVTLSGTAADSFSTAYAASGTVTLSGALTDFFQPPGGSTADLSVQNAIAYLVMGGRLDSLSTSANTGHSRLSVDNTTVGTLTNPGARAVVISVATNLAYVTLDGSTPSSTNGLKVAAGTAPIFIPVNPRFGIKALSSAAGGSIVDVLWLA